MDLRTRIEGAHNNAAAAAAVGILAGAIAQSKIAPERLEDAKELLRAASKVLEGDDTTLQS
jgi:hypothetical protein